MGVLSGIQPEKVFYYFEEICKIPHPSYHEEKISDYCVAFAKARNLEVYQDEQKNVIIIKEATAGYETAEPLIIQGHLDMVCEKEEGRDIDFLQDSLELEIDGDFISARGTTLGGDDGIAVAYALAILDSEDIAHPRLEVVLTVSEEVGMEGATAIDLSVLKGHRLLNIDSEEEGIMLVSCAGGCTLEASLPVEREEVQGHRLDVRLTGLTGGHSGAEIHKGRGNANVLMGQILLELDRFVDLRLIHIQGGTKDNAIPRECSASIVVSEDKIEMVENYLLQKEADYHQIYGITDKNLQLQVEKTSEISVTAMTIETTERVIAALNHMPAGVQHMSSHIEGLVETSLNLGILRTEQEVVLSYSVRSSIGVAKESLVKKMSSLIEFLGGTVSCRGDYPAWEYLENSPLREKMVCIYEKMYGKKPVIQAIHAGLECGILASKIPGLDAVSMGPDIYDIHTTEERLSISSTKRMWEYLLQILAEK